MIEIHKLVRSKRRTLSLVVESDGTLTVRASLRMKEADIRRFIEAKADWIERKQARVRDEARAPRQYVDGETFWYLGKAIPLRLIPHQRPALVMGSVFKLAKSAQPGAESVFTAWYRQQARRVLTERVSYFARNHDLRPGKLRISSARTRWGSCSAKGTLSFTWRLVLAPPEVIDYVVVHELCHLKVMNHSEAFWAQVERILPDYHLRRKWLKKNGNSLRL
ncbi:MAG: M48 family metallopeptidase [Anaerolineales bacterium]|nr:M48 family metallopeptidase [Anaerolineales bacterium]